MQLKSIKYIFLLVFLVSQAASAQSKRISRTPQNLKKYDSKKVHFGFMIGLAQVKLSANYSESYYQNQSFRKAEVVEKPGFNVGIVADYKLTETLNLRFVPALTLTKRELNFEFQDGTSVNTFIQEDESALLDIPLSLKFRSDRVGNARPYVIGGVRYVKDMSSKKEVDEVSILRLQDTDFAVTLGAGVDFYLEYFKFGFEIKYQHGLNNLLVEDESIYSSAFESLHHRGLYFCLTFE